MLKLQESESYMITRTRSRTETIGHIRRLVIVQIPPKMKPICEVSINLVPGGGLGVSQRFFRGKRSFYSSELLLSCRQRSLQIHLFMRMFHFDIRRTHTIHKVSGIPAQAFRRAPRSLPHECEYSKSLKSVCCAGAVAVVTVC